MNKPPKVFITYSHGDDESKDELIKRLGVMRRNKEIEVWHDNEMLAGDRWRETIFQNIAESNILLYLTSASSLESENCNKELAEALGKKRIKIIPIILEICDWPQHEISEFQALPKNGKAISQWKDGSAAWQNVVDGIRKVIEKMDGGTPSSGDPSSFDQGEFLPEVESRLAFNKGNFLLMLGQTDSAIESYSEAIRLESSNAAAYFNRGNAYGGKGSYARAMQDYDHAMQYYTCAIKDYDKAIKINPNFALAYNNRGNAYGNKGNYDRAIKDYDKAIKTNPNFALTYNNRGNAYGNKGNYDRAIKDYDKAIELNPTYVATYNNRGNTYCDKGDYTRAMQDYEKAIKINPDFAPAYYNRSIIYLIQQAWPKAKADLIIVRDKNFNIAGSFQRDFQDIQTFEERYNVKLPDDIVALLK